jgi:pseudouridine synthase
MNEMLIRLNKFLSQSGVASRREADKMIQEGRIKVNGEVVQTLGFKVDETKDEVCVDEKIIKKDQGLIYVMLNKPPGYLVTLKDPYRRPTIMDLIYRIQSRIFPVGRLDLDSRGLLLLTNDGELAHRLMHPRYKIKKLYLVTVKGKVDRTSLSRLEKGIYLEGRKTAPARIERLSEGPKRSFLKIEIHEGRKREIRRMLDAVGLAVIDLQRIRYAELGLGNLEQGTWRHLTKKEVRALREQVSINKKIHSA